jgi:hypothetical protein
MGVQKGFPDYLIFDTPCIALEMKRCKEAKPSLRKEQRQWLDLLETFAWVPIVGYGCDDAIAKLRQAGLTI